MSAEERRLRQEDRLKTIRLRMAIYRYLDEREINTPAAIGDALGMPAAEAVPYLVQYISRRSTKSPRALPDQPCARKAAENCMVAGSLAGQGIHNIQSPAASCSLSKLSAVNNSDRGRRLMTSMPSRSAVLTSTGVAEASLGPP
jgi:hypothetical protein